ncbi:MAG TPA: DUF3644 domain-containing protein [Bacillales bacterium]|nr:DUF3644 domain-containing protein [Bacillales bacterium]
MSKKLLNTSVEAFILGVEVYNKPTIKYRVEGFSFFICNAWELMLKAYMIKTFGDKSIYYKDNPGRTLTLENCVKKIFTNDKDPLRLNLEKIIELRNTSTHFITEEYEMVYIPLFQSCVLNFSEKLMDFHQYDITNDIPQNFLTLNISMQAIDNTTIIAKYPEEIANKLMEVNEEIEQLSTIQNQKFALKIGHYHYLVKDKSKATSFVMIDKNAETGVKIIKDIKDPNQTHPYNAKRCIQAVKRMLKKEKMDFEFNMYIFLLFVDYYNLKSNERYCYSYTPGGTTLYSYSQQTIDFIMREIKKDPHNIIEHLKGRIKKER